MSGEAGGVQWVWRNSRAIKTVLDIACWLVAFPLAFVARLEQGPSHWAAGAAMLALVSTPLLLLSVHEFGLNRHSWAYTSLRDVIQLGLAVGFATGAVAFLSLVLRVLLRSTVPLTVPFLAGAIAAFLMATLRLGTRWFSEHNGFRSAHDRRVLIVGTGERALLLARNLERSEERTKVLGFLDDNPSHTGMSFLGFPVLGPTRDAERLIAAKGATDVLVAVAEGASGATKGLQQACDRAGVRCRYMGDMGQLLQGRLHSRQGDVWGLEEMLHRDTVRLDEEGIRAMLRGKTILITGAGGSIGSEIARQVAGYAPTALVLLGIEENGIFELAQQLRLAHPGLPVHERVADVRNAASVAAVLALHRPDTVFHAAAHKHVPLMEAQPCEAVLNNVGGTQVLLDQAVAHGVQRFVLISTDKAVRSTNVMGATKRVAELLLQEAAARAPDAQMVAVRFGNVLGSRGSVIPTWERQIAVGGPVTITHPDMTRYFMLIPEAVQLVLQAAQFGGSGRIYVLDMGEPVRIRDFAEDLIRQHGLLPGKDIALEVTGLRPGEKMHEELFLGPGRGASAHPKILVEAAAPAPAGLRASVATLLADAGQLKEAQVRAALFRLAGAEARPPRQSA